jgi:hypothetical protein
LVVDIKNAQQDTTLKEGVQNLDSIYLPCNICTYMNLLTTNCTTDGKGKGKVHPCTGTETLYRLYGL